MDSCNNLLSYNEQSVPGGKKRGGKKRGTNIFRTRRFGGLELFFFFFLPKKVLFELDLEK